jgi:hypothetical protein
MREQQRIWITSDENVSEFNYMGIITKRKVHDWIMTISSSWHACYAGWKMLFSAFQTGNGQEDTCTHAHTNTTDLPIVFMTEKCGF